MKTELDDYTNFCLMFAAEARALPPFDVARMLSKEGLDYGELRNGYIEAAQEIFENCTDAESRDNSKLNFSDDTWTVKNAEFERLNRIDREHVALTALVKKLSDELSSAGNESNNATTRILCSGLGRILKGFLK